VLRQLNSNERQVFLIHLGYSVLDGFVLGVLALNEFVLIKSLEGTDYQIGILFQLSVILLLFSILFNEWIRRIRVKKALIRWLALITRLPLLALLLFPDTLDEVRQQPIYGYVFLIIFLLYYLANPIVLPIINLMLKNSYSGNHFGRLYSYATSVNKIVMLVATFLFGYLLDHDPYAFRYVYPLIAIIGIGSLFLFSLIHIESGETYEVRQGVLQSVVNSLRRSFNTLISNKPFRDFEIGFMFYGFAWMMTIAVITIFFEHQLHLNYSSVAFYKNAYNLIAIAILPFFGRLIGQIDPRRFAIITFGSLLFFLFFLGLTEFFDQSVELAGLKIYFMLIPSYLSHAVFAATMSLLWFIGSSYFSKPSEAGDYQSIHLTLTGVRGLFAPLIGVTFYQLWGFALTFTIAIVSLAVAIAIMFFSMRLSKVEKS